MRIHLDIEMFKWNWQVVTVLQPAEPEEEAVEVVDVSSEHPIGFTHNALEDEE